VSTQYIYSRKVHNSFLDKVCYKQIRNLSIDEKYRICMKQERFVCIKSIDFAEKAHVSLQRNSLFVSILLQCNSLFVSICQLLYIFIYYHNYIYIYVIDIPRLP